MNCACGDPSCGYCQAARSQYMNTLYNFDDFIPVDPCNAPLTTILEENEDDYVRDENQNGDEDDEEDDDDYYVEDESSEIVMPQQTGISLNRLNDLQVSEDEKKRLRNTEAARRCREKIKRKTDDLETELTRLTARNEVMNQHRIRLLSQVEEQMRMLENIKSRNPELEAEIRYEAKKIVDTYTHQVETKRKAIQDYFDMTCNKLY